jgi:hypothetical protein
MPSHDRMVCLDCGYDLRSLATGPCPECGRAFDPADVRSFAGPIPSYLLKNDSDPLFGFNILVIALAIASLLGDAVVAPRGPVWLILLFPLGAAAVGMALVRTAAGLFVLRSIRAAPRDQIQLVARRLRAVAMIVVLIAAVALRVGVWIRLGLSTPWLIPAARATVDAGPNTCDATSRWLGLIHVHSINANGAGAVVWIRRSDLDLWAIECSPSGWPIGLDLSAK